VEGVLVPVRDAAGARVTTYTTIDARSEWIRTYPWFRLTSEGHVVTFSHPLSMGRPVAMAQVLLGLVGRADVAVRHRSGDVLDNRIANLEALAAEPAPPPAEGPRRSRYRRVLWDPQREQWVAWGYSGGRYVSIGRFDDELAAARAARVWAAENQSLHFEDDYRAGGFGRALRAPTAASEARRRRSPIGGEG
jgi:hypothetical protein